MLSLFAVASITISSHGVTQGCEPIRFTAPVSLGGEGEAYQPARQWQLTLAYRRLTSNEFFVGTRQNSALGPGGQAPVFRIHTVVADVGYSINDRYRVRVSVPMSSGSVRRIYADKASHQQTARGLGDVSVMGEGWLLAPRTHASGNISFGLGVKVPTGSHTVGSQFYTASGAVDFPAEQTIQPGDGGWALLLQTQAFRQVTERLFGYGFASYMVSPKARSDVRITPNTGQYWSVPDVYSARLGAAFSVLPDQGLSVSLGGRVDGIPVRDLLGGGDDSTIKRTSHILYADPGLSLARGRSMFTLSVPYRLAVNRKRSLFEQQSSTAVNGGGFAKYLVFASYTHRF
jgi:hypothetical protein